MREEGQPSTENIPATTTVTADAEGVGTSLEDLLFAESVRMFELAFEEQFHYGEKNTHGATQNVNEI